MKLSLEKKGRIAPPSVLGDPFQAVAQTVATWPGVITASHWHLSRNGVVDTVLISMGALTRSATSI